MKLLAFYISTSMIYVAVLLYSKCKVLGEESTLVEDVYGEHQITILKKLIANSSLQLHNEIKDVKSMIEESISKDRDQNNNLTIASTKLQDTVENVQTTTVSMKSTVTESLKGMLNKFKSFQSQITQNLSNLKLFVEHQSRQFQTIFGRSDVVSQQILASDCLDLYNLHYNASGTYWLNKFGIRVLCDMETDGGGWLIMQRRTNLSQQVDFRRDWYSYKTGFGNLDAEFWIGNDILHILTNQKSYELRIEMQDYENGTFLAVYDKFRVGNESSNYELNIGNYSGNASDAFTYHHGQQFSTVDRDNDNYQLGNCVTHFSGGWWHDKCYDAHLNGVYPETPNRKNASFITWWHRNEGREKVPLVLTEVVMKIRPVKK